MLTTRQSMPLPFTFGHKEPKVSKNTTTPKGKSLGKDTPPTQKPLSVLEPEILAPDSAENELLDIENLEDFEDIKTFAPTKNSAKNKKNTPDPVEVEEDDNDLTGNVELLADDDLDLMSDFSELALEENHSNDTLPQIAESRLPTLAIKDNLQLYLREISSYPLLNPDEEFELARKIKESGDSDAAFRLVSSHLRLVVKVAMEFQRRWMQNVLDLIQEGNIGLLRAVNKFDPDKGIKFSYYAKFWIRAYILKFIMDNWRMVKIGTTQAQRKLFYNLNKEKQKLIAQGFDPDIGLLSDKLGVAPEDVIEMQQRLSSTDMSLDTPVGEENGSATRLDYLPALTMGIEEGYVENEITSLIHEKIAQLMPRLSEKEIYILENRLLTDDPVTLREIGLKYDVTRERIRQLEARLIAKMRVYLTEEIEDFSEDWIQDK